MSAALGCLVRIELTRVRPALTRHKTILPELTEAEYYYESPSAPPAHCFAPPDGVG